ncbi:helix-turn-helix domain-containing protein [Flavobacterium sp. AG291]|uniref:helix-turn-helix domain-containing protein n=1 Tax=Flavobacterium sp. AG291 TaxID=2184000 RepID=UPI000E0A307A|nr:helix-turn-helix domain-containing protein [Flavobacterium sp. AG291]RDI11208.1 helix-turn-helix protein [Flavobacterium sp. AG291]
MNIEIITKKDLEQFKHEIIEAIHKLEINYSLSANPKVWLKTMEVRKLLGISSGTLQSMRINGTLPYSKIGGLLYYKYEDILKLMESKTGID